MGSISAAAGWTTEDDVVLKSAVEVGASLESLAKGAVCFSRKFTLKELQDRWYLLLYDSEASAQASARIAKYETELLTSNPAKASKLFNSKAKGFSVYKRKIDSVKIQYYARRKRVCHEPCSSADFGYVVVPCSCIKKDGGGSACGCQLKCSEDPQLVHKVHPSGGGSYADRKYVQSTWNGQYSFDTANANSDGSIVIDGDSNHGSLKGHSYVDQSYGYDHTEKNPQNSERNIVSTDNCSDLVNQYDTRATGSKTPPSIDQDGVNQDQLSWNSSGGLLETGAFNIIRGQWCSQAPVIPPWSKLLGVSSPDLTDVHRIEQETIMLSDGKVETNKNNTLVFQVNLGGGVSGSGLRYATMSEGGFMHSNLKGFSEKEDLELFSNEHALDCTPDTNQEEAGHSHTKDFLMGSSRRCHLPPLGTRNRGDHIDSIQKKHNVANVSGVNTMAASAEVLYLGCDVQCILNTKDSETPFNDHIPIPGPSSSHPTSTLDQDSQHDMCLISTEPTDIENVVSSPPPPPTIRLEPAIKEQKECIVPNVPTGMHCDFGGNNAIVHKKALHSVDEGEETSCGLFEHECCDNLQNLPLDKSIQVPYQVNCNIIVHKPKIGRGTAIQSHTMSHASSDTEFHNPIPSMSNPGQAEGSDSEISVPDYFEIDALILALDLIPWDQESDFMQPEVSRFHSPESRKDLIRLEKGACSYMNRSIMSKGALAFIYGQHLRYYIRDTEVTLGRETGEVHVDIDLGKEGKANKISRRQLLAELVQLAFAHRAASFEKSCVKKAIIKMGNGGSFYMKNIGKGSIFVNSKEVPCNKHILLTSDSLIKIRNMKFIFHVNHNAVRQHIVQTMRRSSPGNNTTFDWNQNA